MPEKGGNEEAVLPPALYLYLDPYHYAYMYLYVDLYVYICGYTDIYVHVLYL